MPGESIRLRFKIETIGLISSVLCFVGPIWYLFPLYPLAQFLLLASFIEVLLSLGLHVLREREQIGKRQRDTAEFLIRMGLPLTIVAFSSGGGFASVGLIRTFFSTTIVGLSGTRRLIIYYLLFAMGHSLFLIFRDSPFSLNALFQVYPAWLISVGSAIAIRFWGQDRKLRSRAQVLIHRLRRDLLAMRQSALNLLGFNFAREEGNLFLRGAVVPSSTARSILGSFYFQGLEKQLVQSEFDREWEQFLGRLTKLILPGLSWRWDGSVLRIFPREDAPGNASQTLAEIVSTAFEMLTFARKTEAYHSQSNRSWPRAQCLISTGMFSQISGGPGVPARLFVGPLVHMQNNFHFSLAGGRNQEISSLSRFPFFSGDLADFCSGIFLRETMRPIDQWILPGEWRREILERGQMELAPRILEFIPKPNQG